MNVTKYNHKLAGDSELWFEKYRSALKSDDSIQVNKEIIFFYSEITSRRGASFMLFIPEFIEVSNAFKQECVKVLLNQFDPVQIYYIIIEDLIFAHSD
jgi:hypothetical protein